MLKRCAIITITALTLTSIASAMPTDKLIAKSLNIVANYTDEQKHNAYENLYAELLEKGTIGNNAITDCHKASNQKATQIACMLASLYVLNNTK